MPPESTDAPTSPKTGPRGQRGERGEKGNPGERGEKGEKGDAGGVDLKELAARDVPVPTNGRCPVVLPVVVGDGLALVRCSHQVLAGAALCELHLIHLAAR